MTATIPESTLEKFTTFGDLLRYLRRRVGITQTELSIAVGYSISQISRLEQNLRPPDIPTIQARFIQPLCLEDEPKTVARLLELAATIRREDAPALGLCPYKGLDYFDEGDAELFVGREALTEKLVENVFRLSSNDQNEAGRFFAIVGASGSGKSSLVRAGMVPAIRWNKTASNWLIYVFTPTAHPLESLATTLTRESPLTATAQLIDDLAGEPRALSLNINRALKVNSGTYFLLVIDQFEELFSLCRSKVERSAFIDNLLMSAEDADGKAIIVITLRADFYAHCASYLQLRQALARHQEYIGVMSDEEMRRAIEEPARRGRWEFEPGLVDLILQDVGHEPGALPLLSHALLETWQRRQGRTMTLSGYISSGGVRGAIAETAEAVFTDQLNHEQQAIARRIFLRLTELGDETATGDTRRRATINELIMKPEESDATQVVLKALADARLVTTSEDSVQVAHEALIREWPTLQGWLEDNREGLRLHRQLTEAAQDWESSGHEPELLFRGARLAQAREWAADHGDDINILEKEFLDVSVEASDREAANREAQHQRELETAQKLVDSERKRAEAEHQRADDQFVTSRRLRIRSFLIAGSGVLAVFLAILAIFAWQKSATQAADNLSLSLAVSAQQANQSGQSDLALALAMQSVDISPSSPEALKALDAVALGTGTRAVLVGHSQSVQAAALSVDNRWAFSGSCAHMDGNGTCQAGELILWDLQSEKEAQRWSGHSSWVTAVAISQDGQTLISGADDGTLFVWTLAGQQIGQLIGHSGGITALSIVPATGELLTGSTDGSLILWDLKSMNQLASLDRMDSAVTDIAAALNVAKAVTGYADGTLILWDLANLHPVFINHQESIINGVALNSDASRIFFTEGEGVNINYSLRKLDGTTGKQLKQYDVSTRLADIALTLDGSYALIGQFSVIIQFKTQSWREDGQLVGHDSNINSLTISQDGHFGLSAAQDRTLRVYNLGDQLDLQLLKISSKHEGGMIYNLNAINITSDGKYLLLSNASQYGYDQPVLWDISQRKVVRMFEGLDGVGPGALAISPDNRYVAGAGLYGEMQTVMVWELESGKPRCHFNDFIGLSRAAAFSPDSLYLLAGSQDNDKQTGNLILYDIQTCQQEREFENNEDVTAIKFTSDGKRAITGKAFYSSMSMWDVSSGKELKRFAFPYQPVLDLALGPDETTILAANLTDLYLWDIDSAQIIRYFSDIPPWPWTVDLSPDYRYVVSGQNDGSLILWDYAAGKILHRARLSDTVVDAIFSPDGSTVYAVTQDGFLAQWHIAEKSLPDLLDWIALNRYIRPLTDAEKIQYHIEP
jgi:WD40 repeat protein